MRIYCDIRRSFHCNKHNLSDIIDTFAKKDAILWPSCFWPRDYFDSELKLGAQGGHGSMEYTLTEYKPGCYLKFAFRKPHSIKGFHAFSLVKIKSEHWMLKHVTDMTTNLYQWLRWKLLIAPVHSALINDAFNQACAFAISQPIPACKWRWRVYFLRHFLGGTRLLFAKIR